MASAVVLIAGGVVLAGGQQLASPSPLADRVRALTRESTWTLVASVPLGFRTFHPQGLVKIGDTFVVSSVEVKVPTKRFPKPVNGYDRDTGEGVGHLFRFDARGALLAETTIGEGAIYHPGGLDFDGTNLWVPLTEYRPDSRSILYRVDPRSLRAVEVLRVDDSIGGVAYDPQARTLHGVSWGSRRFYGWPLTGDGRRDGARPAPRVANPSHYVDYQDCKYAGARQMLCTGVADVATSAGGGSFRLGGLDLVSLDDHRPVHQVPVALRTASGAVLTQNPSWFEVTPTGLRGYFLPEDDRSTLYVYDIALSVAALDLRPRVLERDGAVENRPAGT